MQNAVEFALIPMDGDALWRRIGGFGSIGEWHPMLSKVDSEGDRAGARRIAQAKDGSRQVERLQDFDETRHSYRYAMEFTSLPVRDYVGEFRVDDNGDGTSTVIWSAQFETAGGARSDIVGMIDGFLRAGTENLRKLYGNRNPQ